MAKNKAIKKKPSRIRYEEQHPTVSFRLPKGLYDKLKSHISDRGISFADFIKEALGEQEAKLPGIDIGKIRREAYDEGYDKAFDDWAIDFPCAVCRERLPITPNSDCHKAVKQFLKKNWGHPECI